MGEKERSLLPGENHWRTGLTELYLAWNGLNDRLRAHEREIEALRAELVAIKRELAEAKDG